MPEHKQDQDNNLPEFYNYFKHEKLTPDDYALGCTLSPLTRTVIQNLIAEHSVAILGVNTDIDRPLQSEIQRSYLKGIVDGYTTLLSLELSNSEDNQS